MAGRRAVGESQSTKNWEEKMEKVEAKWRRKRRRKQGGGRRWST